MDENCGHQKWLTTPRFVLYQGPSRKVRIIDDAKASALNAAYSSTFKLQLQDNEYIAAMIRTTLTEQSRTGRLATWLGRTLDLSKAYKELAILPQHSHLAVVAFPVGGKWRFYKSIALPFGARGSVYGFVRVAQALWFVVTKLLKAITCNYFDDFPMIEKTEGAKVLSSAFGAVLDMLGWVYAKEGDKAQSFAEAFDALGVTYSLQDSRSGCFEVANKAGRLDKICDILQGISNAGRITSAQAAEVQGLLNFTCGFFATKGVRQLISAFAPLAERHLDQDVTKLRALCAYAIAILKGLRPRKHGVSDATDPILVFTDGALEGQIATAGAVIFDTRLGTDECFEIEVPRELLQEWLASSEQCISQIELWAFIAVRWHYRTEFANRRALAWIDNEAARMCLIKASSHSPTMAAMCQLACEIECSHPSMFWFERVPSFSNPADMPSRNQVRKAAKLLGLKQGSRLICAPNLVAATVKAGREPYSVSHFAGA